MARGGEKEMVRKKRKTNKKSKPREPFEHIASNLLPSAAVAAAVPQSPKHILRSRSPSPIARAVAHISRVGHAIIGPLPKSNYNERYIGEPVSDLEDPAYATVVHGHARAPSHTLAGVAESMRRRPPMPLPSEAETRSRDRRETTEDVDALYATVNKTKGNIDVEESDDESISDDYMTSVSDLVPTNQITTAAQPQITNRDMMVEPSKRDDEPVQILPDEDQDKDKLNVSTGHDFKSWNSPADFYQPQDFLANVSDDEHESTDRESIFSDKSIKSLPTKHRTHKRGKATTAAKSEPCVSSMIKVPSQIDEKMPGANIIATDVNQNEIVAKRPPSVDYILDRTNEIYRRFDGELRKFDGLVDLIHAQQDKLKHASCSNSSNERVPVDRHSDVAEKLEQMQQELKTQQTSIMEAVKSLEFELTHNQSKLQTLGDIPQPVSSQRESKRHAYVSPHEENRSSIEKRQQQQQEMHRPHKSDQTPKDYKSRRKSPTTLKSPINDDETQHLLRHIEQNDSDMVQLKKRKHTQVEQLLRKVSELEQDKDEIEMEHYHKSVENARLQKIVTRLKSSVVKQISVDEHQDEMRQLESEFNGVKEDLEKDIDTANEAMLACKREMKRLALKLAETKASLTKERSEADLAKKESRRAKRQVKLLLEQLEATKEKERLTQETLSSVLQVAEKNASEKRKVENMLHQQEVDSLFRSSQSVIRNDKYKKLLSDFENYKMKSTRKISQLSNRLHNKDEELRDMSHAYESQLHMLRDSLGEKELNSRSMNQETRFIRNQLDDLYASASKENKRFMQELP